MVTEQTASPKSDRSYDPSGDLGVILSTRQRRNRARRTNAGNEAQRRYEALLGQRGQRRLLLGIEIHHSVRGTQEHCDHTIRASGTTRHASIAVDMQNIHPGFPLVRAPLPFPTAAGNCARGVRQFNARLSLVPASG